MAKIIALSTSDIHYHNWKQFNNNGQRINVSNNILTLLFTRGDKLGVPILFGGDLFHTPKGITTKTFHNFTEQVSLFHHLRTQMWGITGNHDEDDNCSLYQAICFAFPTSFSCLDNHYMVLPNGIKVIGIPYMRRNKGLVEAIEKSSKIEGPKILLLHTELYGAPDPSGFKSTH